MTNQMMTPDALNASFESWLAACQDKINKHYAENLSSLTPPTLTVEKNPRYWRIVSNGSQTMVYCFIDPATGDVLKSASYKTPAKGARGNLFDESNGMARMTVYGAGYNR